MNYTCVRSGFNKLYVRESGGIHYEVKNKEFAPKIYIVAPNESMASMYSIDGKPLMEVESIANMSQAREYLNANAEATYLYAQPSPAYEYIREKYRLTNQAPLTKKDVVGLNWDIETGRDENGYSSPDEARCPITAITAKRSNEDVFYTWSTKPLDVVRIVEVAEKLGKEVYDLLPLVRYFKCDDEYDLIRQFISFWRDRHPDYITGWNITGYDIPYLINRTKKLFNDEEMVICEGDNMVNLLSPFGKIYEKSFINSFGKDTNSYDIVGVNDLDYMSLYRKFTYGGQESYTLDHIGFVELKRNKISYSSDGTLFDLYNNDFEKFILYNMVDVDIVEGLDDKLNLVNLVMSLAYKTGANWPDMLSPVKTWDVLIYNTLANQHIMIPYQVAPPFRENYVGAYVREPIPRMYKWVASFDLNSLYPHLQMQYNLSPDRHVPYDHLPVEIRDYIDNTPEDTVERIEFMLRGGFDNTLFKKHNLTFTPNGECWSREGDGFVPKILNGLYAERSARKKEMLTIKQEIEDGKYADEDQKRQMENEIARLDTLQKALKILMNSEYGAMANEYFRHFSMEIAEAITSSGQLSIQWAGKHLNRYMNEIMGTQGYDYVFYMDTDSLYVEFDKMVLAFFPKGLTIDETITMLDKVCADKIEPEINRIYERLAEYVNAHNQKMVMKREVLADKGVWTAKKRYALNVYDSEHVRYHEPKVKIMGLESVRSSIPATCRKAYADAVKIVLQKDEHALQEFISEFEQKFRELSPEDISFPRGMNNLEKYIEWNGTPKKGCPIHVRASILFNKFLIDNGIVEIETIKSGDKIKFLYLKEPNPLHSNVIGFPAYIPQSMLQLIKQYIDYTTQFNKTFLIPIQNFLSFVGWSSEKRVNLDMFSDDDYLPLP